MSVQVLVGRAGTGKTWRCLNAIRSRLREDAAGGHRLIFLVPEQAAFQMERALIETEDIAGFSRCLVLSFRRLAHRIFNEAAPGNRRPLGSLGRLMAVKLLLTRLRPDLKVLRPAGNGAGLIAQLAVSLQEWLQEALEPAALLQLAEKRQADDPLAAERLRDLHRLYTAYREFLDGGRLDSAEELAVAETLLDQATWLRGAEVWVDGFAGFTEIERRMLVRLAGLARSMTITLLIDPASAVLTDPPSPVDRFSLFARTERTYVALRDAMQAAGIEWLPPARLSSAPPPRFRSADLARLEAGLFRTSRGAAPVKPEPAADVTIVAAAGRRVEVDAAVAEIHRLVRTSGGRMRYRDIAIIVRDLEPYHDLLSAALSAHRIPFFIDRRRGTAVHPLVELLRLLPLLAQNRLATEDVRLLLKTGLIPLPDAEADRLENYVIAHGIQGIDAWLGAADWQYRRLFTRREEDAELSEVETAELHRINESRRRLMEPLRDWLAFAAGAEAATGRQWAENILRTLRALNADEILEQWAAQAADDGRAEEADVHRQVWRDTADFLDELVDSLGDVPMSAGEVAGVLDAGLAEFTLGLAPPTLDQVLVGSIERSRHPELAAVLLLGFHDGLFPMAPKEDVLLGDEDREQLADGRPPVGTTRHQRILDEKMLAYIAMTRPSRSLWISYPRADDQGRPLRPSPFVADIRAALPAVHEVIREDPVPMRAIWPIGRVRELAARLALELRLRPMDVPSDDRIVRAKWNALFEHTRRHEALAHDVQPVLASLTYDNSATLGAAQIAAVAASIPCFSASRLETFAACPFRHFARYVLKLAERVEFEVQAIDFGLLHHKVLEEFYAELIRENRTLASLTLDDIQRRVQRLSAAWTGRLPDEALLENARNAFLLERSGSHLREALQRQRLMSLGGPRLRHGAVEWGFGLAGHPSRPTDSSRPLEIRTPAGRTIQVAGKIDRIDLAELAGECFGVVYDYKTGGQRKLEAWKLLNGIDLQLLTYVLALAQRGETLAGRPIVPLGAFYVSLKPEQESVKHPREASAADTLGRERRPRGLLKFDHADILDENLARKHKSDIYQVAVRNDGGISNADRSDAYDPQDWDTVTGFATRKIGELADAILDGVVAVRPYRKSRFMPCSWCEYRAVCRFDHDVNEPREIIAASRHEALAAMTAAIHEGGR